MSTVVVEVENKVMSIEGKEMEKADWLIYTSHPLLLWRVTHVSSDAFGCDLSLHKYNLMD